jgi:hypothetical protein
LKRGPKKNEAPADKPGTALINKEGRITAKRALQKWTEGAIELTELGRGVPPMVYLPPMIRGKRPVVLPDGSVLSNAPTIQENMVRIADNCDPIGALMAAASGLPMVAWIVDRDGKVEEITEVLPLKERIKILKWLGERVMPRLRVGLVGHAKQEEDDGWEAKLKTAAHNAQ